MDEYYEELPVPTFSEGASGSRGMSQANASRASASKAALRNATRASAATAAFIHNLPKNSIITSSGVKVIEKPKYVNTLAIKAAEKRAVQTNILVKDKLASSALIEPNLVSKPTTNVYKVCDQLAVMSQSSKFSSKPTFEAPPVKEEPKKEEPKQEVHIEDITTVGINKAEVLYHKSVIKSARLSKHILAPPLRKPLERPAYKTKVKYYLPSIILTEPRGTSEDDSFLFMNLQSALTASDIQNLLDEFKKYQINILHSAEILRHNAAISMARENKNKYFTSI